MAHDFVQIPPDSTGKKIRHTERLDVIVSSVLIDLSSVRKGATLTGKTSGAIGNFLGFRVEIDVLYIYLRLNSGEFTVGEIITVGGSDMATIDSMVEQHTSNVCVVDSDVPQNRMAIDDHGAAFVRYSEGDLAFDAFGNAQFSQVIKMDEHIFIYGDHSHFYYDEMLVGGNVIDQASESCMGFTTTSDSGSYVARTTNQYYPYNPGEGNMLMMSFRLGDNGQENTVRRWGMFDKLDGLFFEMNGTDFRVGIRNSVTGVPVDTMVSRANFNGDALDIVNVSRYVIDFSKYNIYWLDYQWLGAGRVRFGTYEPDGRRVLLHVFENSNEHIYPYMKRGTLPLRVEQFNSALVASPSECKMVCAAILRQSDHIEYKGHDYKFVGSAVSISGGVKIPAFSHRPKLLKSGQVNRSLMMIQDITIYVVGDPIKIDVHSSPTLTGATWSNTISSGGGTEFDNAATASVGGFNTNTYFVDSGMTKIEFPEDIKTTFSLSADGVTQGHATYNVSTLNPSGSATVQFLVKWKEIK